MENETLIETPDDLNKRYADQFLPLIVCLSFHSVIGIFGNILVIIVFSQSREYANTTFKVFVLYLAILDLLSCLVFIPTEISRLNNFYLNTDVHLCKLKCFLNVFFSTALALVLFFIAFHRYRKVCQPFKSQISRSFAIKTILVITLVSCLLSVPAPIACGIEKINKTNLYNTSTLVEVCAAESSVPKLFISINIILITMLLIIISIALIVMYILISKTLITHWRRIKSFDDALKPTKAVRGRDNAQELVNSTDEDSETTRRSTSSMAYTQSTGVANTAFEEIKLNESEVKRERQASLQESNKETVKKKASKRSNHDRPSSQNPYKTFIWLVLTAVFIVTNIIYIMAAFAMSQEDKRSPNELLGYKFLIRSYFFNNIINPIVYIWLDSRFRTSCKNIFIQAMEFFCRCKKK